MIFVILIIAVLAFFICWNLIPNRLVSNLSGIFFGIITILAIVGIIANFHGHFGMTKKTTATQHSFTSINKQMDMILYQKIGKKSNDQAVIYKKDADQKKPTITKVIDTKNVIKKGANDNKLVTTKEDWVYKNNFYRMMFGLAQKETFIKRTNTFHVDKNYLVLTPQQAKEIGTKMKQQAAQMQAKQKDPQVMAAMKQQGEQYVQGKMMAEMQKNPQMTASQKEKLTKKYTNEFQQEAKNKAKQQMLQTVMQQLKINK
ncbi:hypothetical protein BGL34_05470 [Fructilactobacillus lindneri]|uniref:DUF4811 domain-containing protein n=2 Tax=Fructilactobacillus lindneri TaxID=53444 RepID=A0A0R2JXT2_9LACO|nr:DUF4811 domain-containing protein [Fructilactobacillus lindneri]ANZ57366.1 hypothetical protein AYR60_00495 [Fructilactobacillus lindneri]ANZ58631.1 hypothetical protein AYR59_00495 [Fructilactobacillus lindneri]KRN79973.1 hypothetical protein IV52_GL000090 [Fructilactobacillus lindneri DSM 20690 = JCM 11027]POG97851.1 hypothetical protein BGL31_04935 [Fructilactobacillus lindneri]POG99183.1 hypothetical protein BGL32_04960 [Fructilactobacillus lindneri]